MEEHDRTQGVVLVGAQQIEGKPRGIIRRLTHLSTFESLHIRDYRLLWLGQVGTSMGQWMDQVTRGWLIYTMTGSAVQLGIAAAMRGIPLLLFGILAGAVADRYGRKRQLIIAQSTNVVLNVILATLVLTQQVQPWHIYVSGFLAGTAQAFQQPARQTLITDIVGNRHLMNALALNAAVINGSRTVGPAIAGFLIVLIGSDGSYYMQAAMYFFATIWTMQMRVPDRAVATASKATESLLSSTKEGLAYVAGHRDLRALMILALGPLTLGFPYISLMPIFAVDILHGDARTQGLLLTFGGIGALAGALVVASMHRRYAYSWPVIVGAMAFGLGLMAFSQSHWFVLSAIFITIVGVFNVTYQTQTQTLAQIIAPRHFRGRVMSIYLLSRGLIPVATLLAGSLAAALGAPTALLIMSAGCIIVVWAVVLLTPGFAKLRVELNASAAGGVVSHGESPAPD